MLKGKHFGAGSHTMQQVHGVGVKSNNSSAFGFLLQASSHAKPLRSGLMHLSHYAFSRTSQRSAKS